MANHWRNVAKLSYIFKGGEYDERRMLDSWSQTHSPLKLLTSEAFLPSDSTKANFIFISAEVKTNSEANRATGQTTAVAPHVVRAQSKYTCYC